MSVAIYGSANFLLFDTVTVLSTRTLFFDCPGFLATDFVLGIKKLPSVDVRVVGHGFLDPNERNFGTTFVFHSLSFAAKQTEVLLNMRLQEKVH